MPQCPQCHNPLGRGVTPFGVVYHCPRCKGRMVGLATMRHDSVASAFLKALWQSAQGTGAPRGRNCPHCEQPMSVVQMPSEYHKLELDVCRHCQGVWFDPAEYGEVPHADAAAADEIQLRDPRAREAAGLLALEHVKQQQEKAEAAEGGAPQEVWKIIPAVFGAPVEINAPPLSVRPVATWGLAAVLAAAFLLTGTGETAQAWGFIPGEWSRHGGLTLITSFFLHGGWLHLAGNLYFLVVFGDNVEDRLGKARFLLLAIGAHLAGAALHGALDPRGDLPLVGASGGIFGLVAFYAITFPQTRMGFIFIYRWVRVPAWFMLVFYLALQLIGAYGQVSGFGSVSNFGHLGGIVVGAAAAMACRLANRVTRWNKMERGRPAI